MSVLKNRDNRKLWITRNSENYLKLTSDEMIKVAPPWVEEPPRYFNTYVEDSYRNESLDGMNNRFSEEEFERAIKLCRDKSSPGLDGIDTMIKKLSTLKLNYLKD